MGGVESQSQDPKSKASAGTWYGTGRECKTYEVNRGIGK